MFQCQTDRSHPSYIDGQQASRAGILQTVWPVILLRHPSPRPEYLPPHLSAIAGGRSFSPTLPRRVLGPRVSGHIPSSHSRMVIGTQPPGLDASHCSTLPAGVSWGQEMGIQGQLCPALNEKKGSRFHTGRDGNKDGTSWVGMEGRTSKDVQERKHLNQN